MLPSRNPTVWGTPFKITMLDLPDVCKIFLLAWNFLVMKKGTHFKQLEKGTFCIYIYNVNHSINKYIIIIYYIMSIWF